MLAFFQVDAVIGGLAGGNFQIFAPAFVLDQQQTGPEIVGKTGVLVEFFDPALENANAVTVHPEHGEKFDPEGLRLRFFIIGSLEFLRKCRCAGFDV